jgi:hypothetical protein
MPRTCRRAVVMCFASLLLGKGAFIPASRAQEPAERPRLVVLVVFDQMRGDYLTRWEPLFRDEGFRRLGKEGAWFRNCHYPYATTVTAAGHASLLTGCSPATHGIIGNEWFDRAAGKEIYCVASSHYQRVPAPESGKGDLKGVSAPERLLALTVGDVLKETTHGESRVVSLTFKDRSAVLPAGKKPDACYWFDTETGTFVTSSYYRDMLHPWLEAFNAGHPADRWFGRDWTKLRPELDYEKMSGPDDVAGEGTGVAQGRTFPHPTTGGLREPGPKYYQALYTSPYANDLLLDLVKQAIDGEHLGADQVPDILCVSFSANDTVGHAWGPDSQEVLDVTLRSDVIMKELLAHLDARVGKGRYLLALTADHGVCPLPEISRAQGKDAGRLSPAKLVAGAQEFLATNFGKGRAGAKWIADWSNFDIYLNLALVKELGLEQPKVEDALAGYFKGQEGILTAYSRTQLSGKLPERDALGHQLRNSFHPERSGDVTIVLKPYYLSSTYSTGTTHGSPHSYDTHVPLYVFGPSVHPGVRTDPVTPQAIAAIFARALEVSPPATADASVPQGLFERPAAGVKNAARSAAAAATAK